MGPSLLSSLSFPPLPSAGLLSLSAPPQLVCQSHFWLSEVPPLEPPPPLSSPPSQPSLVVPSPSRPSASSCQALDAPRGQLTRRMALLLLSLPSLSPRLATGQLPKSENDVIVSLFDGKKADVTSAKFDFDTAAEVGKALKNVDACEIRYSCPFKGEQIVKLIS